MTLLGFLMLSSGVAFELGALVGFPALLLGLALLLFVRFSLEFLLSLEMLLEENRRIFKTGKISQVAIKFRHWLARHVNSPSLGIIYLPELIRIN